jgi:GxxExxY protein
MLIGDAVDIATTDAIIRCAIEVHRELGPGLLESVYESALWSELTLTGMTFRRQSAVPVVYKGEVIAEHRPDLIVQNRVVVEVKSVEHLKAVHVAQVLTYLRIVGLRVGLILNFNSAMLKHGIKRVVL